jgi:hypothetical protein
MSYKDMRQRVEDVQSQLTPIFVENAVQVLLRQGEDTGGGVNAIRLVKYLLSEPQMRDVDAVWAYDRLKPAFRQTFEQIPSLYYFEGD